MKIIILTGSEKRHEYFRKKIASNPNITVLATYCEGKEKSLENQVKQNVNSSLLEIQHVEARNQSEKDFFDEFTKNVNDESNPKFIQKGEINNDNLVSEIIKYQPDLLICYGSSLIKSKLLDLFEGRFLNVHLGLSPYYRGSGTNVWPLINNELDMVGATYMYIDAGIDTGKIIHQIRADIFLGDSPHSIGNRLIKKMTKKYTEIILKFNKLENARQPKNKGKLYLQKDFDSNACKQLYQNFSQGMVEEYLSSSVDLKYIVKNKALKS